MTLLAADSGSDQFGETSQLLVPGGGGCPWPELPGPEPLLTGWPCPNGCGRDNWLIPDVAAAPASPAGRYPALIGCNEAPYKPGPNPK